MDSPYYWNDQTISMIGNDLGKIEVKDIDHARIKVLVNGLKQLEMRNDIQLPSGEVPEVEL